MKLWTMAFDSLKSAIEAELQWIAGARVLQASILSYGIA